MVPQRVIAAMQRYDWPGNIRELQNTVHRYITMGGIDFIDADPPPEEVIPAPFSRDSLLAPDHLDLPLNQAVAVFEKTYIERLLRENQWHRSRVADQLGIDRRTLFRKMKAHGL